MPVGPDGIGPAGADDRGETTVAGRARRRWRTLAVTMAVAALVVVAIAACVLQYAVRGGFATTTLPVADAGGRALLLGAAGHRIAGRLYAEGTPGVGAPLVVVVHGDAPFRNPDYHYAFASTLARRVPGVPVAALLRPGFADPYGGRSDGRRGSASGDDYTPAVTHAVAGAIAALREDFPGSPVVLVGHSGGAAISANVAAASSGLVDSLVLVSCPCDVPAFRRHMARAQLSPFWLWPGNSQSPLDTVAAVTPPTWVLAITGGQDRITAAAYARAYVDAAVRRGLDARLDILPGRGHEILHDEAVVESVRQRVMALR